MNAPAAAAALTAQAFKSDVKPVWCPGCGDFSVLSAITKALPMLELRPENVAIVSGIVIGRLGMERGARFCVRR